MTVLVALGQGGVSGGDLLRLLSLEPLGGRLLLSFLRCLRLRDVQDHVRALGVVPDRNDRPDIKVADLRGVQALKVDSLTISLVDPYGFIATVDGK